VDCECPLYLCENGDEVDFVFVPHRMHFFDCETEEAIVL
jgi:multiple sugar transport system ATP-binding protein